MVGVKLILIESNCSIERRVCVCGEVKNGEK